MDFRHSTRNKKLEHWIIIILISSLCLGFNFLISKVNWQVDLSKETKYSLSKESIALLNKLDEPVEIIVTIKQDNNLPKVTLKFLNDIKLLLSAFENAPTAEQIRITFLDVESPKPPPSYLNEYQLNEPNLIIVASKEGGQKTLFRYDFDNPTNPYDNSATFVSEDAAARKAIWESDFYSEWKESYNGVLEPTNFRGEENFVRAMLEIAGKKSARNTAYFTTGHGEKSPYDLDKNSGYSEMARILQDKNTKVSTIDLSLVKRIPDDAKMIVIAGPKGTFQDQEIATIQTFLNNRGGKLLLAIDPVEELSVLDRPAFGLRSLLKEWGIRCHDMLIYDNAPENYDFFSGAYNLRTFLDKNNHEIVEKLIELGLSIQTDRCRPIESVSVNESKIKTKELIFSSHKSLGLSGWTQRKSPPEKNPLLDLEGNIPIISTSEEINNSNMNGRKGKIIAIGSSSILSNKFLSKNTGNHLLGKNIVYWINENPEMLEIPPREVDTYSISMQKNDFDYLLYSIAIVPTLVAFVGIFVGWLRKEL